MAKKPGGELVPQAHGGALRRGNQPGHTAGNHQAGRKDLAYRIRARHMLEEARALEYLKNVITGAEGDYVPVKTIQVVGKGPDAKPVQVTALQMIPAKVTDRIDAIETLEAAAGYKTRPAAPTPVVQAQFVVLAPPKAKSAADWLKMHKLGRA